MIRVLIADDHGIIRDSLKRVLTTYDGLEVVGLASNGSEALEQARSLHPDVILMDAVMPQSNGIQGTKAVKAFDPSIKVLMLTTFSDEHLIYEAFQAGIDGYVLKDLNSDLLVDMIRDVAKGNMILPSDIARKLVSTTLTHSPSSQNGLNATENDIANLLIEGLSNKEIAVKLDIGYGTVRNYISDIYAIIGETDRDRAATILRDWIK